MWHYVQHGISKYSVAFGEKSTLPLEYKLDIVPDLSAATFEGSVTIKIQPNQSTKTIELDSHQLTIHSVTVCTCSKTPKTIKSTFELNPGLGRLIIRTRQSLSGESLYEVQIRFRGKMYHYNPFGLAIYKSDSERWDPYTSGRKRL